MKIELTRRLSDNQDLNITDAIIDLRRLEIAQGQPLVWVRVWCNRHC